MNKTEQVLKVYDNGEEYEVELNWGHIRTIETLTNILYAVLIAAIRAAQSEDASDDEALNMIGFASFQAMKDAGINGEFDAFVASKKARK